MPAMKLADFMKSRDLSPEAFALKIGDVSASGVRKWIAEERVPRKDQIERIAVITDGLVMPNDFFSVPLFDGPSPAVTAGPLGAGHPHSRADA